MERIIRLMNRGEIRYLLIGGQAVRLHGMPRFSMDWDFFVPGKDRENLARLNDALADELDAPVERLGKRGENFVQTYQTKWGVVQFHLGVPGLPDFAAAESRAVVLKTENGVPVKCACAEDLLRSKKAAGRPQDLVDAEFLEKKR